MKKIAIYGGTFDPVHHAHLILAREAAEVLDLDSVLFVPAAQSPHKLHETPARADDRLAMLRAATANEPLFSVEDVELMRPPPSFAIDTVETIRGRNEAEVIFFLVGSDNIDALPTWHRWVELRTLVTFVALERTGVGSDCGYQTISRRVDISATDIRNRVASGRSIRYLVPPAVEEIIRNRQLYQKAPRSVPKT